ncbi:hypothetical protein [Pectobacterium aroidearum]|uniref:hypothetical protein n=1 Tax=Pectobacterium aroidearum TaxID=1201031 RepID=UPI002114765E|nr:hypothetical protein [Pectobacterium aroidearum]UUE56935.1 hypothetical protein L0Y27_17405 [Pectobacterium aroidearum]UUE69641.1 hypothetical protein L0Y21_18295 [Pectobacterium aroidearum]
MFKLNPVLLGLVAAQGLMSPISLSRLKPVIPDYDWSIFGVRVNSVSGITKNGLLIGVSNVRNWRRAACQIRFISIP